MAGIKEGMKLADISVLVGVSYRLCYDEVIQHCVNTASTSQTHSLITSCVQCYQTVRYKKQCLVTFIRLLKNIKQTSY